MIDPQLDSAVRPDPETRAPHINRVSADRRFVPSRRASSACAESIVAMMLDRLQQYERAHGLRKRQRKASDQRRFVETVSALLLDAMHREVHMPGGRVSVGLCLGILGTASRYKAAALNTALPDVLARLSSPDLDILQLDKARKAIGSSGRQSTFAAAPFLIEAMRVRGVGVDDFDKRSSSETIELRGEKQHAGARAVRISYADTDQTRLWRSQMQEINDWLASARLTFFGVDQSHETPDLSVRSMIRIFSNGRFDHGGRLYGGFWQRISKERRLAALEIDDDQIVELDFGQCSARILYGHANEVAPADCYAGGRTSAAYREASRQWLTKIAPQLATLVSAPPRGSGWVHEIKYDGFRMLVRQSDGRVRVLSRNGLDWTGRLSSIAAACAKLKAKSFTLDGEAVVLDAKGVSSFARMQDAMSRSDDSKVVLFAFDLLELDAKDLRKLPLVDRKATLRKLLSRAPQRLRYSDHLDTDGAMLLARACAMGLEGIISKRADAPYRAGRNPDWQKAKCLLRQEFVIVGFWERSDAKNDFGALALGAYEGDSLVYVGNVGTGWTAEARKTMYAKFARLLAAKQTVVLPRGVSSTGLRWLKPKLIGEVAFSEWTNDGILRHPSFQGLREDKRASEVVIERPAGEANLKVHSHWLHGKRR